MCPDGSIVDGRYARESVGDDRDKLLGDFGKFCLWGQDLTFSPGLIVAEQTQADTSLTLGALLIALDLLCATCPAAVTGARPVASAGRFSADNNGSRRGIGARRFG